MFLSDVFYPIGLVPLPWRYIFYWNPISIFSRMVRGDIIGTGVSIIDWVTGIISALVILAMAAFLFERRYYRI